MEGAKRRFITANAGGEPRPMAGATQERTLLGVGSNTSCPTGSPHDRNRAAMV